MPNPSNGVVHLPLQPSAEPSKGDEDVASWGSSDIPQLSQRALRLPQPVSHHLMALAKEYESLLSENVKLRNMVGSASVALKSSAAMGAEVSGEFASTTVSAPESLEDTNGNGEIAFRGSPSLDTLEAPPPQDGFPRSVRGSSPKLPSLDCPRPSVHARLAPEPTEDEIGDDDCIVVATGSVIVTESSKMSLDSGRKKTTLKLPASSSTFEDRGPYRGMRMTHMTSATRVTHITDAMSSIFPHWYDPEFDATQQVSVNAEKRVLRMITSRWADNSGSRSCDWALSPLSTRRILWDLIACVCLLYEFWTTPIGLIFLEGSSTPFAMQVTGVIATVFFGFDIALNFVTGFVKKDVIVRDIRRAAIKYSTTWFALDFVATVPWDIIMTNIEAGGLFSSLRFAKITKALKTLKFIKMVRAVRVLNNMKHANDYNESYASVSYIANAAKVLVICMFVAHVNGCIWAFLQPYWKPSEDIERALEMYLQGLWWAFMALVAGSANTKGSGPDRPTLWVFDMVVAAERLCLLAWLCWTGAFHLFCHVQDDAHLSKVKQDATRYLRRRRVGVNTQVQVLYSIHETGQARNMQRHFQELMEKGLPSELHRRICEELWAEPLMSLGLIMHVAHWHDDLVPQLSLLVNEEVLASKSILFKVQNAAIAAYFIIHGRLAVISTLDEHINDFTDGQWVGEKALVNPMLRRSATVISQKMTTVMSVPGEGFHSLLSNLGLSDEFEDFCNEHLWRGLCGRCGSLGDHFTHECNSVRTNQSSSRKGQRQQTDFSVETLRSHRRLRKLGSMVMGNMHMSTSSIGDDNVLQQDKKLTQFLQMQHLETLAPVLQVLSINNLEDLPHLDMEDLRNEVKNHDVDIVIGEDVERALSHEAVAKYSNALLQQASGLLQQNVQKSQHLIFLSHYKVEAGTEAALIRHEIEQLIASDEGSPAHKFSCPIFLDSEDLTNLTMLQGRVRKSHNIALLLTKNVLTRPWVLVEIVTALEAGARIVPVLLLRGFDQFEFPDEDFYQSIRDGSLVGESGVEVLRECSVDMAQVEQAVRSVFKRIAVPYSPHRPESIRRSELQALLKQCRIKRAYMPDGGSMKKPSDQMMYARTLSTD